MLVYGRHIRWSYESTCNYWPSIQLQVSKNEEFWVTATMVPQGFQKGPFFGGTGQGATLRQCSSGFVWKKATGGSPKPMICMKGWTSIEFWKVSRIIHRYAITQSIVQKPKCCPAYASDFPAYQQLSCTWFYFGRETKLWVWGHFRFQVFSAWFLIWYTLIHSLHAFPSNEDTNLPEHSGTMASHSPWEFWWLGGFISA